MQRKCETRIALESFDPLSKAMVRFFSKGFGSAYARCELIDSHSAAWFRLEVVSLGVGLESIYLRIACAFLGAITRLI